jgi:hypothetical protein
VIIPGFTGIHNTVPIRGIPDTALSDAVNVDLTDSGAAVKRFGSVSAMSAPIETVYSMEDGRVFAISDSILCEVTESLELIPIAPSTATSFDDFADILFTNDGVMLNGYDVHRLPDMHSPTAYPVVADGGVTTLPEGVNTDPIERFADGFPQGVTVVSWFEASLYCAQPVDNNTVIWQSKPFHYHLYDYDEAYIQVPGEVVAMERSAEGLCIATTKAIYLYNEALTKLADYGVVRGRPIVRLPSGQLLIYSVRGVCTIPFQNLTEAKVSLPPGRECSTAVVDSGGISRFIALQDGGGTAHNKTF